MFREIVEDIHSEGKITDEEMEQLNREACNRASLFGDYILKDENLEKRGDIYVMCAADILDSDSDVVRVELTYADKDSDPDDYDSTVLCAAGTLEDGFDEVYRNGTLIIHKD